MRIQDYEHADCKLFRVPVIDLSAVDADILAILMTAWQQGSSAEYALDQLLTGDVARALQEKIEPNISHQRRNALGQIINYSEARVAETEEEKKCRLEELDAAYAERAKQLGILNQETDQVLEEKRTAYTAAQARMLELHRTINERLNALGGKKKMELRKKASGIDGWEKGIDYEDKKLEDIAGGAEPGGLEDKVEDKVEEPKAHRGPFHAIYSAAKSFFGKIGGYFRK